VAFYAHTDGRRAHLCTTDGRTWDVGDLVDAALGPDGRVWFADAHVLRVAAPPNWVDREAWRNDPVAVDEGMAPRTLCVGHSWVFVGRRDGRLIRIPPDGGTAVGWPLLKMPVAGLALSPDESRLLVGGEGGEVRLVDPATGAVVEIPDAHRADVPAVAFGRHFFVTGSADRRVRLWTPDGQPIATLRMQGPVRKVLLSDDERSLLVLVEGERAVRRWRLDVLFEEWRALDVGADLPPV
jgi:sugar lactone lactonase YvrE